MELQNLYKIIVVLVGVLIGSWSMFGYFVVRYISGNDRKFCDLYKRTEDLPAIRRDIEWLKDKK